MLKTHYITDRPSFDSLSTEFDDLALDTNDNEAGVGDAN